MKNVLFFFVLFLTFENCLGPKKNGVAEYGKSPQDLIFIDEVMKLSLNEAITKLGQPFYQEKFLLRENMPGQKIILQNVIPDSLYKNKKLYIQELSWHRDSVNNLTLWYQEKNKAWVPIQHSLWMDSWEF